MNTQELKCFLRVAERMNFTRAAQELYLTPPTVTHHIQKLESELGVRLFQRNSKSSKHTLLRIGCLTSEEAAALSKPLSILREKFPDVEPRIIISDFSNQLRMLKEDHLDLLLGSKDMIRDQDNFQFTSLHTCRSCAVFAQDYIEELSVSGKEISLEDLKGYPLIALHSKSIPMQPDDAIEEFLTSKSGPTHIVRQEDAAAVMALAFSGYGIGILPEYVLPKSEKTGIHHTRIKESPWIEYGIIRCRTIENPYITKFSDIIESLDFF